MKCTYYSWALFCACLLLNSAVQANAENAICKSPSTITPTSLTQSIDDCNDALREAIKFNQQSKISNVKRTLKEIETQLLVYSQISKQPPPINSLTQQFSLPEDSGDNTQDDGNDKTDTDNNLSSLNELVALNKLNKMQNIADTVRLIPTWRDATFTYQFYAGVEYGKVGAFFDDSDLRLGFQTYVRLFDDLGPDRTCDNGKTGATCNGLGWNAPHLFGNVVLTGSSEATVQVESEENSSEQENEQVQSSSKTNFDTLEYELGAYFPFYNQISDDDSIGDYREMTVGLLVVGGGRKVDDVSSFYDRYYAGLRISHNEETYFDLLYGKSEPLSGKRLEIRGQLPVATLGEGRVFLGGIANLALSSEDQEVDEESHTINSNVDAFKVFVTWQTTFSDLWGSLGVGD